jgi:hypothetical protein
MSASTAPNPQPLPDPLEFATDQAIASCDDDIRATVRALIIANGLLESELRELSAATSRGFARGPSKSVLGVLCQQLQSFLRP